MLTITSLLLLIFGVLFLLRRHISIPHEGSKGFQQTSVADFRRPENEYILDDNWNFNAPPTIREYNFTITNIVGDPDGVYRTLIAINKQLPGPLIECNEGDVLKILVDNHSVNATALHFHGIYQNGTNWMDGASGVTQCPIAPGRKFEYVFNVTGQSGTYYYHGHQGVQTSDGLFGPLIVHSRKEREVQNVKYASDRVVMLQDHYHVASDALLFQSMRPGYEGAPSPDGALINGRNTRDCSLLSDRLCDNSSASHATFSVERAAAHRLRFINAGALAYFHVSLDEHNMTMVEADGIDLVPVSESRLMIAPAQRYSVIVQANETKSSSFWLCARMMTHCYGDNPANATEEASEIKAIVRYMSPASSSAQLDTLITQLPTSTPGPQNLIENCLDMPNLTPLHQTPFPTTADTTYYLESNIAIGDWRLERGYLQLVLLPPQSILTNSPPRPDLLI